MVSDLLDCLFIFTISYISCIICCLQLDYSFLPSNRFNQFS